MAALTLYIVFNPSAGAGLRDALRQSGRDERVVSLFDSLSFGPINPPRRHGFSRVLSASSAAGFKRTRNF